MSSSKEYSIEMENESDMDDDEFHIEVAGQVQQNRVEKENQGGGQYLSPGVFD